MTINTSKVVGGDCSEVPVFEVELVRQRTIPYLRSGKTSSEAAQVLHAMLDKSPVEQMVVLYLSGKLDIIGAERIAIGDTTTVGTSFSTLLRGAILSGVRDIIIGHNHTIGDVTPSNPDLTMTGMTLTISSILGIYVYDHIIVSPDGTHYSMFDSKNKPSLITRKLENDMFNLLKLLESRDPLATKLF